MEIFSRLLGSGEVVLPYGRPKEVARIYEALQRISCAACGRDILAGEHFTRGRLGVVVCDFCQQFVEDDLPWFPSAIGREPAEEGLRYQRPVAYCRRDAEMHGGEAKGRGRGGRR
jgi:hypothetical protein